MDPVLTEKQIKPARKALEVLMALRGVKAAEETVALIERLKNL